ncbi:hypothetical protein CRG98_047922 [Punica granatum]|uniref:Reverse transcriptase Ty1/copia-type domain-containing protein n=1 Tax=Punica granatum TaxID=22663 RepID=A0A2I0HJ35_PUNGR|nr:hypothetical protein CRG98_047922 [Punica granatum]
MVGTASSLVSSFSSSPPIIQTPTTIPTIPIKLNGQNYLYWRGVMTPLLATYGMLDHVEGRATASSKTSARADGVQVTNHDYLRWESRYNFALTCVMLAVTEAIRVTILTAKTSHEAWTSLERAFVNQTATQEDLLDQQWRDLKKGSKLMAAFINSVKEHVLRYAQIGKPKTTTEINRRIYTGLSPEWEPIVLAQSECMLTISTDEFQSLLVGHEEWRLYAATHGAQTVNSASSAAAPLSGILGAPPIEAHNVDGRNNQNGSNKGQVALSQWMPVGPLLAPHLLLKADGTIDRYKAQLVAKGFNQREGVDYSETFSPVIKSVTIRTVLSIVVSSQWPIRQLDVKNAFIHGHLTEEVYMSQPPCFINASRPNHVCRLRQSLYGLKQAPRAWIQRLNTYLQREARTDDTGLYLTQSKYIHDILTRTSMLECKPISSPVSSRSRLSLHNGDPFEDPSLYRSVSSKEQRIVTRSSTESEYKSLANATTEILWLQSILQELGVSQCHPPTLWYDNISVIYLTANPIVHARTKNVEIDYHFARERFMHKQLYVRFINSDDQLADALTKGLSFSRFADIHSKLHVAKFPFDLRGSSKED